jgi:hypothetical protein
LPTSGKHKQRSDKQTLTGFGIFPARIRSIKRRTNERKVPRECSAKAAPIAASQLTTTASRHAHGTASRHPHSRKQQQRAQRTRESARSGRDLREISARMAEGSETRTGVLLWLFYHDQVGRRPPSTTGRLPYRIAVVTFTFLYLHPCTYMPLPSFSLRRTAQSCRRLSRE